MCPGQHIAKRVASAFIALILHKLDAELAFTQPFPIAEKDMPDLGIAFAKTDLVVSLQARV